jgi:spermidine synthase
MAEPQAYDLIIADIFTGSAVPRHVTNAQFVKLAAAPLAPGGLCLANVIDGRPLVFTRALAQAVRDTFADTGRAGRGGRLRRADPGKFPALPKIW